MDLTSRLQAAERAGREATDAELVHLVQSLPAGDTRRDRMCEILVARYQPIVASCARHYQGPADLIDELMQVGYLGLMKAIRNFDPQLGSNLAAYARPCISGEIKRYFRDRRWHIRVQRPVQELRLEIREAAATLTQRLARMPEPAEIAGYLNVSEEQIIEAQSAEQAYQALSLDAPVTAEDGSANLGDLLGEEDPRLQQTVDIDAVQAHWAELDDQAQLLLGLRFYGNMTQEQIAQRLGVSQMQVSRLLRRALDYLRECLTAAADSAAPAGIHDTA